MKHLKFFFAGFVLFLVLHACGQRSSNRSESIMTPQVASEEQIIVDVRSPEEWANDGHANCTVNYPLPELETKLEELKKYKKVIFVCRSGNRAGIATNRLKAAGHLNVENGGAWQNVSCR